MYIISMPPMSTEVGLFTQEEEETMQGDFYEPLKRYLHCSAVVQNKWYNYGGCLQRDPGCSPAVIEEFDPVQQVWKQHQTFGDPPPGYIGSAAAAIHSKFYVFGGLSVKAYYKTVYELDVESFLWTRLDPRNQDGVCPIPKIGAGMVSFDNKMLVTFGGKGISTAHVQRRSLYARNPDSCDTGLVWTNELLCFDTIKSKPLIMIIAVSKVWKS